MVAGDWAAKADGVGCLGVFDANDFGAEIGEDTGAGWPGDDPGKVADADAREGKFGHGRRFYADDATWAQGGPWAPLIQ